MLVAAGGGMEIVSPRHPFGIDGADAQAVGRALVGVVSARRVAGGQEGGDEQGGGQGGEGGHWVPWRLMVVRGVAGGVVAVERWCNAKAHCILRRG